VCFCVGVEVKYLGEEGEQTPLIGAISMSNPFDFVKGEAHFDKALFLYDFALTFATIRTFSMYVTTSSTP
jgi:predicted alpha/beta-fold hydrolase